MKKYLLFLFFITLSCSKEIHNEFPDDCIWSNLINCDNENTTELNFCIDCELCKTDSRLSKEKLVIITIETLPDRTGMPIDTIMLDDKRIYSDEICIPIIENQDSLVIGLLFLENEDAKIIHAVYDKIKINKNSTTQYLKSISSEDLWEKPPCDLYTTISRIPDTAVDAVGISCIVGSPGDCIEFTIPFNIEEFYDQLDELEKDWQEWYDNLETSTPCGEIYTRIY